MITSFFDELLLMLVVCSLVRNSIPRFDKINASCCYTNHRQLADSIKQCFIFSFFFIIVIVTAGYWSSSADMTAMAFHAAHKVRNNMSRPVITLDNNQDDVKFDLSFFENIKCKIIMNYTICR
jgi:hypothetical protein